MQSAKETLTKHVGLEITMSTSLQRIAEKARSQKLGLAASWMRKRVSLKSPVRENRTPGSARGRLGNWASYLDHARLAALPRVGVLRVSHLAERDCCLWMPFIERVFGRNLFIMDFVFDNHCS